jgi:transcriptional regulator
MHPNRKFNWSDRDELLDFVQQRSFSIIAATVDGRPCTAHAPVSVLRAPDRLQFHLAVGNALTKKLAWQAVTIVTTAFDGYISPDWYVSENQVPTWNYLAAEITGVARQLSDAELIHQLDALSAEHEGQLPDKAPWTRHKMTETSFAAMLNGITGFEVAIESVYGTAKLGQNKSLPDFLGAVDGLMPHNPALSKLMQNWRNRT